MSGNILKGYVNDLLTGKGEHQELKFSGSLKKEILLQGPESGLEVKVHFTSDYSVTAEGVQVDLAQAVYNP